MLETWLKTEYIHKLIINHNITLVIYIITLVFLEEVGLKDRSRNLLLRMLLRR